MHSELSMKMGQYIRHKARKCSLTPDEYCEKIVCDPYFEMKESGCGIYYFGAGSFNMTAKHPFTCDKILAPNGELVEIGVKEYQSIFQWMLANKAYLLEDTDQSYPIPKRQSSDGEKGDGNYEKIMETDFPVDLYKIANKIRQKKYGTFEKWSNLARDIVYFGCYLKYRQNSGIYHSLMATKNKILADASFSDSMWGIGMTVQEAEAVGEIHNWKGRNWFGQVLTRLREDFANNRIRDFHQFWA